MSAQWLIIFTLPVVIGCPVLDLQVIMNPRSGQRSPCYCSPSDEIIDCSYSINFEEMKSFFHDFRLSKFNQIKIHDTNIETLDRLGNLSTNSINVIQNKLLSKVTEEFFLLQTAVKDAVFIKNSIAIFPFRALKNLKKLQYLSLLDNKLTSVPTEAFSGMESLTYIDLSYNLISEIGENAFLNIPTLEKLYLIGNKLKSLAPYSLQLSPSSSRSRILSKVYLAGNRLTALPMDVFGNEYLPYVLDISRNLINIYDQATFGPIIRNVLRAPIQRAFLTHGNPVPCDCAIYWIYNMGKGNPIVRRTLDVYCFTNNTSEGYLYRYLFDVKAKNFVRCFNK